MGQYIWNQNSVGNYYCEIACASAYAMQPSLPFTELPYTSIWLRKSNAIFETRDANPPRQNMSSWIIFLMIFISRLLKDVINSNSDLLRTY